RRPSIVLRYWFFPGLPPPSQSATQPLPKSSLKQTPGLCGCASSPLDDAQRRRPVAASCSNDPIRVSRHDDFLCTVAYAALGKSRDAPEKPCPLCIVIRRRVRRELRRMPSSAYQRIDDTFVQSISFRPHGVMSHVHRVSRDSIPR